MVDKSRDEPTAEQLLRIKVRREAAATVVVAEGEIDMLTVGRLRAAVDEALRDAAGQPVVVDLTEVTYLGSHGLAALAEAASKAQERREPLRLVVDETRAVIRPMQVSGLDEVLATLLHGRRGGVASVSEPGSDAAPLRNDAPATM